MRCTHSDRRAARRRCGLDLGSGAGGDVLISARRVAPTGRAIGVDNLGFYPVSITRAQVWAVRDLPFHHRGPFDRLLLAQAQDLGVPLITADPASSAYDVAVLW
jgi:hypothetical protein